MIGIVDCAVQAKYPNMPLDPMVAYVSSPSSIRVRNAPKRIGKWCIENVQFVAAYPDGSVKTADCVLVGGIWTGTIEGTMTSGTSKNGYTIFAGGTDENGNAVTGYILGKGDIEILEADGTLNPDAPSYYVHLLSAQSETPKEGDLYPTLSGYMIWQDGEGHLIGDDSGAIEELQKSKRDILDMDVRGLPKGDVGWFVVDGTKVVNVDTNQWGGGDFYIAREGDNQYKLEIEMETTSFVLDSSFTATADGHSIVGYASEIASQAWVEGNEYATKVWVYDQHYMVSVPATYKTYTDTVRDLVDDGYATQNWVEGKNYLTSVPNTYKTYADTVSSLSNDGYVTTTQLSTALSGKADLSDLRYGLVTPGEWEFSDGETYTVFVDEYDPASHTWMIVAFQGEPVNESGLYSTEEEAQAALDALKSCTFEGAYGTRVTATRASLPGHLLDRAINKVEISSVTTLTLPQAINGKARDFLVRVTIPSGTTVAGLITFAGYNSETLTYETDDDSFPEPDDVGTWLYSFTETTAHTFAVSLKSVSTVTQGGNA